MTGMKKHESIAFWYEGLSLWYALQHIIDKSSSITSHKSDKNPKNYSILWFIRSRGSSVTVLSRLNLKLLFSWESYPDKGSRIFEWMEMLVRSLVNLWPSLLPILVGKPQCQWPVSCTCTDLLMKNENKRTLAWLTKNQSTSHHPPPLSYLLLTVISPANSHIKISMKGNNAVATSSIDKHVFATSKPQGESTRATSSTTLAAGTPPATWRRRALSEVTIPIQTPSVVRGRRPRGEGTHHILATVGDCL